MPSTTTTARIAPRGATPTSASSQRARQLAGPGHRPGPAPPRRPQTTMAQTQCNPSSDPGTAGLPWARAGQDWQDVALQLGLLASLPRRAGTREAAAG